MAIASNNKFPQVILNASTGVAAASTGTSKLWLSTGAALTITSSSGGEVVVGSSVGVAASINQAASDGAVEVLTLTQADIDQNMIKYIGASSTATANQSLVNAGHFTTPGAITGWVQITIQDDSGSTGALPDTHYWMPLYATPTA